MYVCDSLNFENIECLAKHNIMLKNIGTLHVKEYLLEHAEKTSGSMISVYTTREEIIKQKFCMFGKELLYDENDDCYI